MLMEEDVAPLQIVWVPVIAEVGTVFGTISPELKIVVPQEYPVKVILANWVIESPVASEPIKIFGPAPLAPPVPVQLFIVTVVALHVWSLLALK